MDRLRQGYARVFVAGMPRAGSMWTYNVLRACLLEAGFGIRPEQPPASEKPVIRQALTTPPAPREVWCIKTHEFLPRDLPGTAYICNYRDVRDAVVSYARFMHCDQEFALNTLQGMMQLTDYYMSRSSDQVLPIRYDDICSSPNKIGRELMRFLGIYIPDGALKKILQAHSRKNIQSRLKRLEYEVSGVGPKTSAISAVQNLDGSHRLYDNKTGFQTRHITGTKPGDWRQFFDQENQVRVEEICAAWLKRYHFDA